MNDEKYILILDDTDSGARYFWTGESFSQNKEGALKNQNSYDFRPRAEINRLASEQFPNCVTFVFRENPVFIGFSAKFKNGRYVGLM